MDRVHIGLRQQVVLQPVGSADAGSLRGVVEAYDGSTVTLALGHPGVAGEVEAGASVVVLYHDEEGIHRFETHVLDVCPGDPDSLTLEAPDHVDLEQRRRHLRVAASLALAGAVLDRATMTFLPVEGTVQNLSGGGLRMVAGPAVALAEGSALALALRLPEQPPVLALGTVVAREPAPGGLDEAEVRVAFGLIDASDRERMVRWLLRQMRQG